MYVAPAKCPWPKHAAVVLNLGKEQFIFEDTRYFGRLTFDVSSIQKLGPEPLDQQFTTNSFAKALKHSHQPIKVKLLDQSVVAGIGNIYASEALFRAKLSPQIPARKLTPVQVERLWKNIRRVLTEAIQLGSTIPLDYAGLGEKNRVFYFGSAPRSSTSYEERLRVYDRAGHPCLDCGTVIKRALQAGRSTFYCPTCQSARRTAGTRVPRARS